MSTDVKLPQLGEQVDQGVVLSVLVSAGDRVDCDEVVLELETDKATTEVPSPEAGTVGEVRVQEGDEVVSGDTIFTVEANGGGDEQPSSDGSQTRDVSSQRQPHVEPQPQQPQTERTERDDDEAGGEAEASQTNRSAQTDMDRFPEGSGGERPDEQRAAEGDRQTVRSGQHRPDASTKKRQDHRRTQQNPPRGDSKSGPPGVSSPGPGLPTVDQPVPAAPSIRRFARQLGVELSAVAATGAAGRVTEDDVKSHVRHLLGQRPADSVDSGPELPDFSQWGATERIPMAAIRRATADHVSRAWDQIPHVTQYDRADVTELEKFRARLSDRAQKKTEQVTVTAILVKVAAVALRRFPDLNASVDPDRGELILKRFVHIGVAVDTDEGLLVPVLRDVDQKGLVAVAGELAEKAGKARAGKLSRDDLSGGTFSVTNLGGLGTTRFTPIIGWPQVAILSVGRIDTKPVWSGEDDQFEPRQILPLGITFDHRAVDGADAARFLRWIAATLENPMRLIMEG